ncbi:MULTISPECIES: TIGR02678 family protein [unclassified Actinopolyspora]|uniref:TIGR02678 family protein n=1 Tax=unclassified Actinopolyspora TaxID=2639451 RepID=UPI0013F664D0|nr:MULTISPECIES: TIGR02678 family protein [unclassified Actinopolyspora]NHD16211.1 TIGR02678 family protein [Actinopolyspora sp. BKK2]NHE75926.1 TIGR02678 family protein [Actinopolyspora sp. BKK1]
MSNLNNQLVATEREELARCIRVLLAHPLLLKKDAPKDFDTARRRHETLRSWFDYYCGWTLTVMPRAGYARLHKSRGDVDASRPARRLRSGKAPFDRRRYALLCVVAAELLATPTTHIAMLAERVRHSTGNDPVVPTFDTSIRSERMAYVDVLRLLESYAVLDAVDGTTESFVDSERAQVLYRVDSTLLMRLLSTATGPSRLVGEGTDHTDTTELIDALSTDPRYGTTAEHASPNQRNLWARHSVMRKLFDDPVVYWQDLTEQQHNYATSLTGLQLIRKAAEEAGFALEERKEGVLLVDREEIATDSTFPDDSGNAKIAALRLLDELNAHPEGVTTQRLHEATAEMLAGEPRWAKSYRSEDGTARLVDDALRILTDFDLAIRHDERVVPRPAAARYRLAGMKISAPAEGTRE